MIRPRGERDRAEGSDAPSDGADAESGADTPIWVRNVSRRDFVRGGMAVVGSGLVLGVFVGCGREEADEAAMDMISGATHGPRSDAAGGFEPNVWVRILPSGDAEITCSRSEMGQGARTAMAAIVADELEADWGRVHIVQAPGDARYGDQNTDGSRSVRNLYEPLRQAGAVARRMLEEAAADEWGVPVGEVRARGHRVVHEGTDRSASFADLVQAASARSVPEDAPLKDPADFRYIGHPIQMLDGRDIATGRAVFGADVSLPGMRYAVIQRSPVVGGSVASMDDTAARAVAGVVDVQTLPAPSFPVAFQPLGGVAVLAENTWAALEGRRRLDIRWNPGPNAGHDSAAYRSQLEAAVEVPGRIARDDGDADAALDSAADVLEARYWVPYLAHAPMEPPACVAHVTDGGCQIWAPTQDPQTAQGMVAGALGLDPGQVEVHVTLLGGGFGRKSKPDFIVEAAILSRRAGAPVKLQWTREDEIQHGFYHAASAQKLEAALGDDGLPTVWRHRSAFPSISTTFDSSVTGPTDGELGLGAFSVPWNVPNVRLEACDAPAHVRIGWLRSVSNIHHAFAVNSFADELAHAAGRDPLDYLLDLIGPPRVLDLYGGGPSAYGVDTTVYPYDTGRLRAVAERAAREAGWGSPLPEGRARGIAAHYSFVTYVAQVVEASVENGRIVVHRVDCVCDCGQVVNPDRVRAQMEGGVVFGLSLALHGEITARDGAVVQGNFDTYPIARISETPEIHVHLMDSTELPTGVGEPGVPPTAPALANAIHAATGRRLRELPLRV